MQQQVITSRKLCVSAPVALPTESVTMTADGRFIMLDRYGAVREAVPSGDQMLLNPQPLAHLGPGRPLGARYDAHGNLIICDAFKVCTCAGVVAVCRLTRKSRLANVCM